MGQRTSYLIKKNFIDGTGELSLIHHQWGIGKVMPNLFLQEFLKVDYPLDRSSQMKRTLKDLFNFEPLSSPQHDYIHKQHLENSCDVDVFDKETVKRYFEQTDNNNGGMIIELWERPSSYNKKEVDSCSPLYNCRISFVLGNEECYKYIKTRYTNVYGEKKTYEVETEEPFTRFVSLTEFMSLTGGRYADKKICKTYQDLFDYYGIEQVIDDFTRTKGHKIIVNETKLHNFYSEENNTDKSETVVYNNAIVNMAYAFTGKAPQTV